MGFSVRRERRCVRVSSLEHPRLGRGDGTRLTADAQHPIRKLFTTNQVVAFTSAKPNASGGFCGTATLRCCTDCGPGAGRQPGEWSRGVRQAARACSVRPYRRCQRAALSGALGDALRQPLPWAIITGLLLGKGHGIGGLAHFVRRLGWVVPSTDMHDRAALGVLGSPFAFHDRPGLRRAARLAGDRSVAADVLPRVLAGRPLSLSLVFLLCGIGVYPLLLPLP